MTRRVPHGHDAVPARLFRVELLDSAGTPLGHWWADEAHARPWAAAQLAAHQPAHPDCTVRLVPLPDHTPMVTPGGELR